MMSYYDNFGVDKDKYLLDLYKAGSVISYIAMLMNIGVFVILCRKTLLSPATILMQGLAAADFLTALSYYGLEPVFQSQYHCDTKEDIFLYNECYLPYPYCSMAFHLSISSFTFHTVSYTITTCLGIQKVLAILFPIWTKYQLTNKKAVVCCVVFFLLSITISIPRHFSAWFRQGNSLNNQCSLHPKGEGILQYSSIYYLMIQTILVTCCCLVMLMSTVFILYKLLTNKFRGRMTEQRRQERRSVIMVIIILVVFLLTEVPKAILYLWWCYKYIAGHFSAKMTRGNEMSSLWLIRRYENAMSWLLVYFTDMVRGSDRYRFIIFKFPMEGINLITIVGCMSNFIIYFVMSTKMRNEIILLLKKMCNYCAYKKESNQIKDTTNSRTDEMEMNQIDIIGNKHVYEVERNWTHMMGNDCTYSIGIDPTQETRDCTKEIERNQILETGDQCAKELERNQMQGTGDPCAKEIERNQIQGTGDHCTKEIERNQIQGTGDHCTKEIEKNQIQGTGDHCTKEIERNQIQGTGDHCTKEIERNQIQGIGDHRTKEIERNQIQGTGDHRTKEIERNQIQGTGDHCTKEIERNQIQGIGDHRTKEIERNQIQGIGDHRTKKIEKNPIQ